jgi:hypothetical protein
MHIQLQVTVAFWTVINYFQPKERSENWSGERGSERRRKLEIDIFLDANTMNIKTINLYPTLKHVVNYVLYLALSFYCNSTIVVVLPTSPASGAQSSWKELLLRRVHTVRTETKTGERPNSIDMYNMNVNWGPFRWQSSTSKTLRAQCGQEIFKTFSVRFSSHVFFPFIFSLNLLPFTLYSYHGVMIRYYRNVNIRRQRKKMVSDPANSFYKLYIMTSNVWEVIGQLFGYEVVFFSLWWGEDWVHLVCWSLFGLLYQPHGR